MLAISSTQPNNADCSKYFILQVDVLCEMEDSGLNIYFKLHTNLGDV